MSGPERAIVWRMMWKEYRALRGFWLALLALVALCVALLNLYDLQYREIAEAVYPLAIGAVAFYALGSLVTSLANEHEEGTAEWLRALPARPARLAGGKLLFVAASCVAFLLCATAICYWLAGGELPTRGRLIDILSLWGVATLEALAYGFLLATILRRPLVAICVTIGLLSLLIQLATGIFSPKYLPSTFPALDWYPQTVWPRLGLVALVAGLDVWLAPRWLNERTERNSSDKARASGVARARRRVLPSSPTRGLAWQGIRQGWAYFVALAGATLALLYALAANQSTFEGISIYLAIVALLFGCVVFLGDQQRGGYRFFAEHGVSGWRVWRNRHAVALGFFAFVAIVLGLPIVSANVPGLFPKRAVGDFEAIPPIARPFVFMALGYGAGQFCSMLLRSGLLAGVCGVMLGGLFFAWAGLMLALGVPWWWSVLPIPVALLAGTFARAPHWILERGGLAGWRVPLAVTLVPLAAIAIAFPLFRAYEIPLVEPGFDARNYARNITPAERETAAMYRRAYDLWIASGRGDDVNWREALALAVEASRRPSCAFFDPWTGQTQLLITDADELGNLGLALARFGGELSNENQLEAALSPLRMANHLRQYTMPFVVLTANELEHRGYHALADWSVAPQRSESELREALDSIQSLQAAVPPPTEPTKSNYVYLSRILNSDVSDVIQALDLRMPETLVAILPWERMRSERVLRNVTRRSLEKLQEMQNDLVAGRVAPLPGWGNEFTERAELSSLIARSNLHMAAEFQLASSLILAEIRRRGSVVQFALQIWRSEHGELPESIAQMSPEVLHKLPADPRTGEPFLYYRDGLPQDVTLRGNGVTGRAVEILPSGTPFLWSQGFLPLKPPSMSLSDADLAHAMSQGFVFPIWTTETLKKSKELSAAQASSL